MDGSRSGDLQDDDPVEDVRGDEALQGQGHDEE